MRQSMHSVTHVTRTTKETGPETLARPGPTTRTMYRAIYARSEAESMSQPTYLDLARAARNKAANQLDAIARETSPVIVLGRYFANPYDASVERGRIIDRCVRDMERLDAAIARLTMAADPFPQDAGTDDVDDGIVGVPSYDDWFGAFDRAGDVLAAKQQEADELAREVM